MDPDKRYQLEYNTLSEYECYASDNMTYDEAMAALEESPLAALFVWDNGVWNELFHGAVEFVGVMPE